MCRVLWVYFQWALLFWKNLPRFSSWQLHQMFAHAFFFLQLICPLKDIFPLLCFYWVWVFHMISGWVRTGLPALDGRTFLMGRRSLPGTLHPALQEGVPDPPLRADSLVSDPPCKASLQDLCTALPALLFVWFPLLPFFPVSNSGAQLFPTCVTHIHWWKYPYGIKTMFLKISLKLNSQLGKDFSNLISNPSVRDWKRAQWWERGEVGSRARPDIRGKQDWLWLLTWSFG